MNAEDWGKKREANGPEGVRPKLPEKGDTYLKGGPQNAYVVEELRLPSGTEEQGWIKLRKSRLPGHSEQSGQEMALTTFMTLSKKGEWRFQGKSNEKEQHKPLLEED